MRLEHFLSAGALCGVGFTMSLFIANLAFPPEMRETAKIAILFASGASAIVGLLLAFLSPGTQEAGRSWP